MNMGFAIILTAVSVWFAFPVPVSAQPAGVIQGVVVAEADRSSLAGATVALEGSMLPEKLETTTGADGRFRFARLAPGDYLLSVNHDGFRP
jgi:hypothetical protein